MKRVQNEDYYCFINPILSIGEFYKL